MSANVTGPRQNLVLEALSLSPSGEFLFAGTEGPVFADGAPPTTEAGALSRITRFDVATGTPSAQFAYPLDPVAIPTRPGQRADRDARARQRKLPYASNAHTATAGSRSASTGPQSPVPTTFWVGRR